MPTNVGALLNTNKPVPVSSDIMPSNSADDVAANADNLFDVYATVPPAPNVIVLESVPERVSVLFMVTVLVSAIDRVDPVATEVIVTLFNDVADATPRLGVTSVGLFDNTGEPVPVGTGNV